MVPAGNKANCLSLVNHTTKTIHHHHHKHVLFVPGNSWSNISLKHSCLKISKKKKYLKYFCTFLELQVTWHFLAKFSWKRYDISRTAFTKKIPQMATSITKVTVFPLRIAPSAYLISKLYSAVLIWGKHPILK